MKRKDVDVFEKLTAQLDSLHAEVTGLSKKSPNDAVNAFKLKFVNATLSKCNELFGPAYKPFNDFEIFSSEDLPSNSDVTFIVSQYIECAEKFRSDNITRHSTRWYWNVDDEPADKPNMCTYAPRKLDRK
jgi:hypothetical protein